jgi:hypothetical protein
MFKSFPVQLKYDRSIMTQFVYGVIAVPWDSTSVSKYCSVTPTPKSSNHNWGQAQSSCVSNLAGILNKPICIQDGGYVDFTCVPVTSMSPISCKGPTQIYPVMLAAGQIPLIEGADPSRMGNLALDSNNLINPNYAAPTDVATTGSLESQTGCGYLPTPNPTIVLVYPVEWFLTWADIDKFTPSNIFGGPSLFLNTGTQTYTFQGKPIPQLEDQLYLLLQNFCAGVSSTCLDGVNPGYGYCSNIFAKRTDNGSNYCNAIYNAITTQDYPTNVITAVNTAIGTYCSSATFKNNQAPPECLCADPTASPYYVALSQAAQKANINVNNPYTPDTGFTGTFGNIGCWWFPCQAPQTALVPLEVQAPQQSGTCPTVCSNVVDIVNSGTMNLSGATIAQNISCCAPVSPYYQKACTGPAPPSTCTPACTSSQTCVNGTCQAAGCGSGQSCPVGQQCSNGSCITPCSVNSGCPSDETCSGGACVPKTTPSPSFLSKYWWALLIGVIFLLLLLGLLVWFLAK